MRLKSQLTTELAQNIPLSSIRFINLPTESNFKARCIHDKRVDFLAHSLSRRNPRLDPKADFGDAGSHRRRTL